MTSRARDRTHHAVNEPGDIRGRRIFKSGAAFEPNRRSRRSTPVRSLSSGCAACDRTRRLAYAAAVRSGSTGFDWRASWIREIRQASLARSGSSLDELTLVEQLGNIGSEVGRASRAKAQGNEQRLAGALDRALELFDLTLADARCPS